MNNSSFFDLTKPIVLSTSVVELRPLQEADYELLLPFALNEPELWTYSLVSAAGEAGLKNYLQIALNAKINFGNIHLLCLIKGRNNMRAAQDIMIFNCLCKLCNLGILGMANNFKGQV